MSQVDDLLSALKAELRARGMTYADVATHLGLSESSIKRSFAAANFPLQRLDAICQMIGVDFTDLLQRMASARRRTDMLTEEQEREVVQDERLLLCAISVLNGWQFAQIVETYNITEHECIQLLAHLDRLKMIELLPNNRIRLMVASDFRWIPGGPIQQFFREQVQPDFLDSRFEEAGETLLFGNGMLSRGSNALLAQKMEQLLEQFQQLHREDASLPLEERFGSSILIALRPWEYKVFQKYRRQPGEKLF